MGIVSENSVELSVWLVFSLLDSMYIKLVYNGLMFVLGFTFTFLCVCIYDNKFETKGNKKGNCSVPNTLTCEIRPSTKHVLVKWG